MKQNQRRIELQLATRITGGWASLQAVGDSVRGRGKISGSRGGGRRFVAVGRMFAGGWAMEREITRPAVAGAFAGVISVRAAASAAQGGECEAGGGR